MIFPFYTIVIWESFSIEISNNKYNIVILHIAIIDIVLSIQKEKVA